MGGADDDVMSDSCNVGAECEVAAESLRSPSSRAARAGRPAAGRPASRDLRVNIFAKVFYKSPCRPAAGRPGPGRPAVGRPGYILVNFENENIFL